MSELEHLRPELDAIPADAVIEPNIPVPIVLQEAHDLHVALDIGDTWAQVIAVGLDPALISSLRAAIAAARQAQSQWTIVRDRSKPRAQREREVAGEVLRRELVAAIRWNLHRDQQAQGVLDRIAKGEGVPDLVQDLEDLAALITSHQADFVLDTTFDAPARAEIARTMASEISEGLALGRADVDQAASKRLRDRAYTHLVRVVAEIRRAGRYAFREQPQRAAVFTSRYRRRIRRAALRRRGAAAPAVVDPAASGSTVSAVSASTKDASEDAA